MQRASSRPHDRMEGGSMGGRERGRGAERHPEKIRRAHEPQLEGPPQNARKGAAQASTDCPHLYIG